MYQYLNIANANTDQAASLCSQYGIYCNNVDDVANGLYTIASHDEDGLKRVMNLNPEKDLILSFFSKTDGQCPHCKDLNRMRYVTNMSANGTTTTTVKETAATNNNINLLENNKLIALAFFATIVAVCFINTNHK